MDVDDESEDKISVEGDESEGEENDEVFRCVYTNVGT